MVEIPKPTESIVSSITLASFGRHAGKKIFSQPESVRELFMGTITGIATGCGEKTDADTGEVSEFLTGTFECEIAGGVTQRSGKAFLPDSVMPEMIACFFNENGEKQRGISIPFAYDAYVVRDTCKAGYKWELRNLMDRDTNSPLAKLKALTRGRSALLLAAPE